jgi:DNA-binding response OmpR family regulator
MSSSGKTVKPTTPRYILVIDDDEDARHVLRLLLKSQGYEIDTAADGNEGLKKIAERLPDLLILDVMMPGINGVQMTRKLKASPRTASIPIIMLTALTERKYMQAALFELDVDYYITKPFEHDDLLDKVRQAIRFRRISPDAVEEVEE